MARSACEPHREWIEAQVRLGRNAVAIYQELVDQRGFTQRYNSVKRFCRGLRRREPEQFDRLEFGPAEESQVDYGEGAPTRHPVTGKYRKPRLFVMTLRYSRRSYRQVVWKSSSETWARLHEQAFRYFGGSTNYCVLDNLKEGVITPDIYEPTINRLYAAVLAHHHCVADPARVRDPDRKGTVENAIQHTQATALKGKKFESLEAQNQHLMDWEERWAATRVHGRAKRQVEAMFQEEKPFLTPLPLEPFRYFKEGTRTVQDDRTVQVNDSWYAARPARIGSQVIVRIFERDLEIRDIATLELIRCHTLAYKKGEVLLPDEERIFNPSRQTRQILRQAEKIGPNAQALCQRLFDKRGREAQKSMWGIVALVPRFPVSILEQAATAAILRQISSSKAVRAIAEQLPRLSGALATLDTRLLEAQSSKLSALEMISDLLQDELDRRQSRLQDKCFQRSGLPERVSLSDFDWSYNPQIPKRTCCELNTLKFIAEGINGVLVGKAGTGKSHVAKAVAYSAVRAGLHVAYVEADELLSNMALAAAEPVRKQKLLKPLIDADLLVVDDLFLRRKIAVECADELQSILHRRYSLRRSSLITTNRLIDDCSKCLGNDAALTTAILDRLMHRCIPVEFRGRSYRLKEASSRLAIAKESE